MSEIDTSREAVEKLIGDVMTGHIPVLRTRDVLRALLAERDALSEKVVELTTSRDFWRKSCSGVEGERDHCIEEPVRLRAENEALKSHRPGSPHRWGDFSRDELCDLLDQLSHPEPRPHEDPPK